MTPPHSSTSAAPASPHTSGGRFTATRWSMVLAARDHRTASAARRAMGELAQIYWFPLYAYLRRKGHAPAQAEDLVQGFFARLLEKEALDHVDRAKGRFRAFLLASLQHYVLNEWDKARTQKRGGGRVISLDALAAEARYAVEPVDDRTPERVYERRWALAVLDQVLAQLRESYHQRGQGDIFAALEHVLTGQAAVPHAGVARRLGLSESAVKVAAHRLRRRYRDLLRREIAHTVADPAQVEEEIRQLLASL